MQKNVHPNITQCTKTNGVNCIHKTEVIDENPSFKHGSSFLHIDTRGGKTYTKPELLYRIHVNPAQSGNL